MKRSLPRRRARPLSSGVIRAAQTIEIVSEMSDGGAIFGDGIEEDRPDFGWGMRARIGIAPQRLRLVTEWTTGT